MWQRELIDDSNETFILDGICCRFHKVPDISIVQTSESQNYKSALEPNAKMTLDALFLEELNKGPISKQLSRPHRVQAIGAVPKKGSHPSTVSLKCSMLLFRSVILYIYFILWFYLRVLPFELIVSPYCFTAARRFAPLKGNFQKQRGLYPLLFRTRFDIVKLLPALPVLTVF